MIFFRKIPIQCIGCGPPPSKSDHQDYDANLNPSFWNVCILRGDNTKLTSIYFYVGHNMFHTCSPNGWVLRVIYYRRMFENCQMRGFLGGFPRLNCQPALVRAGMTFYSPNLQFMPGKKESCRVGLPIAYTWGYNTDIKFTHFIRPYIGFITPMVSMSAAIAGKALAKCRKFQNSHHNGHGIFLNITQVLRL